MKKTAKKLISLLLVAVMVICAAPLSGFVGIKLPNLFGFISKALETEICPGDTTGTLGHLWSNKDGICARYNCGYVCEHPEDELAWETVVEPTCANGIERAKCNICNIHTNRTIVCDSSTYPESAHNYSNSMNKTWSFSYKGATKLALKFSTASQTESGCDYIYIYDSKGFEIGKYDGDQLSGVTIELEGDSFSIKLTSDSSVVRYGFKFDSITATIIAQGLQREIPAVNEHDWSNEDGVCANECGTECAHIANPSGVCDICGRTCATLGHDFEANGVCGVCGKTGGVFGDSFVWTIDAEGCLVIVGSGKMPSYSWWNYYPWNENTELIKSVVFGNEINSIGEYAFINCSNLESVTISDSVTSIGYSAFNKLTQILCNKDSTAHTYAVENGLAYWLLDDENQKKTISGKIGTKLTWSIDKQTRTLTINNEGAMISFASDDAPWKAYKEYVRSIVVNDGCTNISQNAFYGCEQAMNLVLPNTIKSIDDFAFYYCVNLRNVVIPESVTKLGSCSFESCKELNYITIGNNVTEIGNNAICTNTTILCYNNSSAHKYALENSWQYRLLDEEIAGTIGTKLNWSINTQTKVLTIDNNGAMVSFASDDAPWRNYKDYIDTVVINEGCTNISQNAFYECDNIISVELPDTIETIGDYAFYNCNTLKNITIPENVTSLGNYAFYYCSSLEEIDIPENVTALGSGLFSNCASLSTIEFKSDSNITSIPAYTFYYCNNISEINMPKSINFIDNYAFCCASLGNNDISFENVTINSYAFQECKKINFVEFINCSIGYQAFYNSEVVSIDIDNCVFQKRVSYYYETYTFKDCSKLKNISISNTDVLGYVFRNCNNIETIKFKGDCQIDSESFNDVDTLSSVIFECTNLNIGSNAFYNCDALTSVSFECTNLSIGSNAFYDCDALTSVSLNCNSTEENSYVSNHAFYGCDNLESAIISVGIDSIGSEAFANCPKLEKVTIYNKNCEIAETAISIYSTIYGFTGSTAEEFANIYGYNFISIDTPCEHKYNNDCDTSCNICGVIRETGAHNHSEWTVTKEASCNKKGLKERVCSICGEIEKETIEMVAHTDENDDGICEVCKKQFEIRYPMNGICGPDLTWVLDDEGVLTISGNGNMFDFNGSNFVEVKDMSGVESPVYPETTTSTNYWQTTTAAPTTTASGGPGFDIPDDPRLDETTVYATTVMATTALASEVYSESSTTKNQHIPHPDEYVATTSYYPYTTEYYNTTTKQSTTQTPTTATTRPPTTTAYYPETTTAGTTEATSETTAYSSTTAPPTTTQRYSVVPSTYATSTQYGYTGDENSSDIIRVYRWNLHFDKIKKVVIEDSVTTIGNNAFADCQNIVSVEMPDSIKEIGEYAFNGCSALTEIEIPVGVSYLNHCAFLDCSSLETLNFNTYSCKINSTAFNNCNIRNLNIDANVKYLPTIKTLETVTFAEGVTFVPDNAFSDCYNLKSVSLPDTLESIGNRAFYYCSSLESIDIPDSVTNIGSYAFRYCKSLTTVTTPSGYCYISSYAFGNCENLTTLNFNTTSGSYSDAFYDSYITTLNIGPNVSNFPKFSSLEVVTFADGATTVPSYAFSECYNLKSVVLSDTITVIGKRAFYYCSSLNNLEIPDSVYYIGDYAFAYCFSLKNLKLPLNLEYIGSDAFYYCIYLTEITIPEDVYQISYNAFGNCILLETLNFNAKNCSVSSDAFYQCPIKTLNVGAKVKSLPNFRSVESVTFAEGATKVPNNAFSSCTLLTSVTLPDSIKTIGYRAFDYCTSLESIRLPKNLQTIGEKAFYSCYNLKSADLPASLNRIEKYTFDNCQSLEKIIIPDSVTYIGQYAFYACILITSITIPENVQTLGRAAFGNCYALESVEYNAIECVTEPYYYDYRVYDVFYGCNNISSIEIGSNVTRIIEGLMKDKSKITSVEIPSSVKEIGGEAFRGTSLSIIDLPNGVEIIGADAFGDIATATEINIPETVQIIKPHAFANITALEKINFNAVYANVNRDGYWYSYYGDMFANSGTESDGITVVFGDSVEVIPEYLFEVGSETAYPNIKNVVIGSNVKTIGNYAFYHCCSIENIDFGANVETIGSHAFDSCIGLKSIELPESIKNIYYCAFYSCNGLTEITIPENLEYIESEAFDNCHSLETVNFNAINCYIRYAFDSCFNLKTVRIGNEVESIPAYTFSGATNLEKVYIPDIAINISPLAFDRCEKVTIVCKNGSYANVYAIQNSIKYILEDNVKGTAFEIRNDMLLGYSGSAQNIVLPSKIDSVGIDAFNGNSTVKSIEIPYNVSTVYSGAFANCPSLERVIIPFTVTDISASAFTGTPATIYCYYNSYAYHYAVANGISYELITVSLSTSSVNIIETESITVDAVPSVTLASGIPLVWKSENPAVASVDITGKIVGNAVGSTTVGVYTIDGEMLDSCSVTVGEKAEIKLETPSTDALKYGEKLILHVNTSNLPDGATVKWTTTNGDVLKISNENAKCSNHENCVTCTVESVGNGSAEIKATIVDESGKPIVQNDTELSVSFKMNSKVNIWQKIIAFFKKIFGLLKTYPQVF